MRLLTANDVGFIQQSRKEIRTLRTVPVILIGDIVLGEHPITKEPIVEPFEHEVTAIVTEVSVRTSLDRRMDDGIEIRTGDILVDISIDEMPEGVTNDDLISLNYDGKDYTVLAADKIGLGGYNRIEIIGRLTK